MNEKVENFISIVFCVRKNCPYAEKWLKSACEFFENKFKNFEIICVNNMASMDEIEKLKVVVKNRKYKIPFTIVNLSNQTGIDYAISAGTDLAIGDFIYEFDTLLIDYNIEQFLTLYYKMLDEEADIVGLTPNKKKTIIQNLYYIIYSIGIPLRLKVYPETFRIVSRRAVNRIDEINFYSSDRKSIFKTCGLKHIAITYKGKKEHVEYTQEEFKQRLSNAYRSLVLYTNSIQNLFICIVLILTTLLLCFSIIYKSIWSAIVTMLFFILALLAICILNYLKVIIEIISKKQDHLIRSIQKVNE